MQFTSHSISDFKQKVVFSDLPKPFQDAVTTCVALDIGYIWIDSLCILQDSPEDWAIQGSKMAQVCKLPLLSSSISLSLSLLLNYLINEP